MQVTPSCLSSHLSVFLAAGERWAWLGALVDEGKGPSGDPLGDAARWPAAMRVAPRWLLDDPAEQAGVRGRAVKAIVLEGDEWDDERVRRWIASCRFDAITDLSLYTPNLGQTGLVALLERWPDLRSLSLRALRWDELHPDALASAGPVSWYLCSPPDTALEPWVRALEQAQVETLELRGARLSAAAIPRRSWPRLRCLSFDSCEFDADTLAGWLAATSETVDRLTMSGVPGRESLGALAAWKGKPRYLQVHGGSFDDSLLEAMGQTGCLARLSGLAVQGTAMTDDGLDAIARHLGSLRALELSHTALSDTRLASIIRAAPRLERLGIASTGVTGDGIAAALGPEGLARMIELDAGSAKGTARALAEIAGPELPRLQYLGLSSDAADAPGLAALLDHALLHLTVLDLDGSRLGTLELERPVHLPALRHLDASYTRLDLATAEHLFDPTALPALRTLLLEKNRLSPAAGDVLARFLSQVPVRSLDISGSYRWPAETYAAVLAAGASSLVHLAAGNHGGIEDGVVDALTRAPWPALNRLDLSEMQLSVAQQQQLHLAECPRLTFLAMGYSELEELEALAGNPLLRRLTMLHASATSHDDEYALIEEFIRSGGQLPADALIMS